MDPAALLVGIVLITGTRARLAIILALGTILFVVPVVLGLVGQRQVTGAETRLRATALTARVTPSQLLAAAAQGDIAISEQLGVDSTDIELSRSKTGTWCVDVRVARLIAERRVRFTVTPGGTLLPTSACS